MNIKKDADGKVLINAKLLNNESYFNDLMMQMVVSSFENTDIKLEPESARYINNCVTREYISEYQGMPIL
jgi:type I restriction enzyme R subunit